MLSSTSSSNQRLPKAPWSRVLLGGLAIAIAFGGVLELRLAARGFRPDVDDNDQLWAHERARVSSLGDRALVLVGASRIQLDMDLGALRRVTGLEPVQLGISGSSFVPVLEGLARDERVTGTVIVDFVPRFIAEWDDSRDNGEAANYQRYYELSAKRFPLNARASEAVLSRWRAQLLRAYADGGTPLSALLTRILSPHPLPQYLTMLPDRSRLADYRRVPMPGFYYGRVERDLDSNPQLPPGATYADLDNVLRAEIAKLGPENIAGFRRHLQDLQAQVDAIQKRGGHVIFVEFPTSGLVREMIGRRYPRNEFWDQLVRTTTARTLHYADDPMLSRFTCPDGSHLDYTMRPLFSRALASALGLAETDPNRVADRSVTAPPAQ